MRNSSGLMTIILCASLAVLISQKTSGADCTNTSLISKSAFWKYNANDIPLEASWKNTNFDDGSWPSGQAILGFGESDIKTQLPAGAITYYFRKSFTLSASPSTMTKLTLLANYDDGFVAYLNGQEVARRAMPNGMISHNTLASSHEGGAYESIDLTTHLSKLVIGANVLAVEVHQNAASNNDLVMDLELTYQFAVCVVRGPYLQSGSSSQMIVRWRTDVATNSRVRYSANPNNLWRIAEDLTVTTEHVVQLSGLTPSTKFYYSVGSTNGSLASGADYYFVTAPPPGRVKRTRVWVLGDAGTNDANQQAVRDAYYNFTGDTHTDLWVMLGDNAYDSGTDREYQAAVFDIYPAMLRKSVLWPAFGNHDGQSASSPQQTGVFYNIFSLPKQGEAGGLASGTEAYYSFNFSNVHFICLNSEDISRASTGAMLSWLQQDLAANTKHWTVAFWHHPPYSKGSHDSDLEPRQTEMRQRALPLLENGGVDLVLTGHSHSYERSFLLDRHYDVSTTLTGDMILDAGNGRVNGDGAYLKPKSGSAPHQGTVYVVAGSSGKISGGALNHPAMYISLNVLGSMVLDFNSDRVDAKFLDRMGSPRDYFTIIKGVAPPSSLTATAASPSQIDLAWTDKAYNENGFKIECKIGATGTYTKIATVGANVIGYSHTGLTDATAYYYRVQAYNSGGNSQYSTEANAMTPPNPPTAPSSLTASSVSSGQINLAWADNANNEDGFKIERKTGAAGAYSQIATAGTNVTSFANTGLSPSTAYFYRVRAYNTGGNSVYSNEASATTRLNPPAAPSSLLASTVSNGQINLAWVDNANNEDGFKIERKIDATGFYTEIATVGANARSYSNTGLTGETTYYYRVQAYNSGGNSMYSNEANATTPIHLNLAFNKPATALSTNDSNTPGKAVDENTDTYWRSASDDNDVAVWWRVDLGVVRTISRVIINWQSSYFAEEYAIQVSHDDVNYTAVYTNNSGNGGVDEAKFNSTLGRYVRIYITARNKSSARIKEIEVYAGAAASAKATVENVSAALIPETITLAQNYPNPFNPTTTISYSVPAGMDVNLKVVNIAGREVATLVNGYHEAGVYRVTFEASPLPSGVYFSILKADESTKVMRMLFMK